LAAFAWGVFGIAAWGCGGAPAPQRLLSFEEFEAQAYREAASGLYVVDGDTPVRSREELRVAYRRYVEDRSSLGTRRRGLAVHQVDGVDAKWDDVQALNISYCVSTTFDANYEITVKAMEEATAQGWEIPANVHFIHEAAQDDACDETNEKVVFDVRPIKGVGYLARAFFPTYERAVRNILINTNAFGDISPWTVAGVEVTVRPYDFSAWFERLQRGTFELSLGWTLDGPTPYTMYRHLMSTETVLPVGAPAATNWGRFGSARADELLRAFERTADAGEQHELARKLQHEFVRAAPAIPLYPNPAWGEASTRRFVGFPGPAAPYARLSPNVMPECLLVLTEVHPPGPLPAGQGGSQ